MAEERVSYQQLADRWAVTVPAAKARVRRYRWHRQAGNDGLVIVTIPDGSDHVAKPLPHKTPDKTSEPASDVSPAEDTLRVALGQIAELQALLLAAKDESSEYRAKLAAAEARLEVLEGLQNRAATPERSLIQRLLRRS